MRLDVHKPWGMGVTMDGDGEVCYGFAATDNPENFHPDYEVCTEEEIQNHKNALTEWEEK